MDKRFINLRPQTCKDKTVGSEPSLQYVLEHYYTSHGIKLEMARKLTDEYVVQWVTQESSNAHLSGSEAVRSK
jgi:hypothetical protein